MKFGRAILGAKVFTVGSRKEKWIAFRQRSEENPQNLQVETKYNDSVGRVYEGSFGLAMLLNLCELERREGATPWQRFHE